MPFASATFQPVEFLPARLVRALREPGPQKRAVGAIEWHEL